MRFLLCTMLTVSLSAATVSLSPIIVKAKKEIPVYTWKFIENLNAEHIVIPGFEEQQLQNVPGVNTTTTGNPGQLTSIKIQGADSKYTKVLWSGLSITEMMVDASLIPLSTGTVEVVKGVHCAEYGNGAIAGVANVIPFSMPDEQNGGLMLSGGNYAQSGHLWWCHKTKDGFSLQQHIENDAFHGKNSIPKRYQTKYPIAKSPETEKRYFLNQLGFDSHHVKTILQIGLIKSASTGSDISLVSPYDSRSKRTVQIYAFDLEWKNERAQPYLKSLSTIGIAQDFSPYIGSNGTSRSCSSKAKFGVKIKSNSVTFEPVVEYHDNTLDFTGVKQTKNKEYAFAQGVHVDKETFKWRNWARVQKADHYNPVYAFSSSLLKAHNDTEFSVHLGTGFRIPDLYMLNDKKYGNKNLKNESAYGGNLGIAQKTQIGIFNVLFFKTEYRNQIDWVDKKYQNIKRAKQEGFEIGWKNKVGLWGAELSAMYAESASLKPKKSLMNTPRTSAHGRIFYEQDNITTSVGWRYIGHQTQPDFEQYTARVKRGGYPVFFGDFQYKFREQARWFVSVENALARKIESPSGYRNPGFQINTGINITW